MKTEATNLAPNGEVTKLDANSIHKELEEVRFISSFMAAIGTSLELDEICSIAARALYEYSPFYRMVFKIAGDVEGRTVTFAPLVQRGSNAAKSKVTVGKATAATDEHDGSLASAHLTLLDNLGSITVYFKTEQHQTLSESLMVNVASSFSQAIRNAHTHSSMKDLAMRDGLTSLYNRRIFDKVLAEKTTGQDSRPVSLLILDLDNFKRVNDTFGHDAGDQVLQTCARILKESCRGHDLVARFGGEEFAIILSQTKATTAHAIAQRIRHRVAKTVFIFDDRQLHVTASIGLATCQGENGLFTANLVKQADKALYQAKRSGRNRVCMFPSDLLSQTDSDFMQDQYSALVPAAC